MKKTLAFFICIILLTSIFAFPPEALAASKSSRYAQLSGISTDAGTWNKEFLPGRYSYKLTLGESQGSVTITPLKADESEIVKYGGKAVESVTVSVDNGKYKYVKLKVYLSGKKSRTYTIKVMRAKSTNNDLSSLSVSGGSMDPEFDPAVFEYNVTLDYYAPYATIKAAKVDSHSLLRIAGRTATSKQFWVNAGETKTVLVTVRSQTRVTKTYTIHITRESGEAASQAEALLDFAQHYAGMPYVRGGKGPDKFDCSGFVYYCLNGVGVNTGYMTSKVWPKSKFQTIATLEEMLPGDILCFKGHVGIYMGDGMMIDAGSSVSGVSVRQCTSSYWASNFICGKRPIQPSAS